MLGAVLGLVAVAAVLRTRRRVRHTLYETLREERRRQVDAVRSGRPRPAAPILDSEPEVRESATQLLVGHLALVGGLVAILLGIMVLLALR